MSKKLYATGKKFGVVIGHYGQIGPDENNDYRQNSRVVFYNGTELFRTTKNGKISDFKIRREINKRNRIEARQLKVGVGTEGTSHPNP